MTCPKLYAKQFARYQKQKITTFNETIRLQMNQQKFIEKNLSLEQQFCSLNANIDKLRFQLRQKNMHAANLRRIYLSEKKEIIALDKNKILKMENELMKV